MSRASKAQLSIHNASAVLLAILLVMATIGPSAMAQSANNSKRRDLAGRWRLNRELSVYSAALPLIDAEGNQPPITEAWTLPVKNSQSAMASTRLRELLDATTSLAIFQHGRELTMNATGSDFVVLTRTIYTDGRSSEQRFGLGDNGESQAHWSKDQFIVETETKRGPKLTETYELSRGGKRLYLLVKIENENWTRPLLIRRVYDRDSTTRTSPNKESKFLKWRS
jgi:hypothetical protein